MVMPYFSVGWCDESIDRENGFDNDMRA